LSGGKGSSKLGGVAGICKIEETEDDSVTTRFYDIAISATDAAGNIGTKTCSVIVIPDDHYSGEGSLPSKGGGKGGKDRFDIVDHDPDDLRREFKVSTKRYVISELSLEWDPNLDTTLEIPPLPVPEPDSGKGKGKGSRSDKSKDLDFPALPSGKGKGSKSGQLSCSALCSREKGIKKEGSSKKKSQKLRRT
jgi:hypothetical protein